MKGVRVEKGLFEKRKSRKADERAEVREEEPGAAPDGERALLRREGPPCPREGQGKEFFEKRAAEKRKRRQELSRVMASGKVNRAKLQRKNAHFVGMKVRLELERAKALW